MYYITITFYAVKQDMLVSGNSGHIDWYWSFQEVVI